MKDLAQLINVRWLTIRDGTLDYNLLGSPKPELSLDNIDIEIDLAHLLNSVTVQETRRSIHTLRIGSVNLEKEQIRAGLQNFFIDGSKEVGTLGALAVQLSSGMQLQAANLYWEGFSWDDFIRNESIHIDTLNIPTLNLSAQAQSGAAGATRSGLLPVTIGRLNIGHSVIGLTTAQHAELHARVNKLAVRGLQAAGTGISWQDLDARADSIAFKNEHTQIAIQRLHYAALGESAIHNITYTDSAYRIKSADIQFQLHLTNAHPDKLRLGKLAITGGVVNYHRKNNPPHHRRPFCSACLIR